MTTESLRPVLHAALNQAGWSSRYEPTLDRWVHQPPPSQTVLVYGDGRVIHSNAAGELTYYHTTPDDSIVAEILGSGDAP